MKNLKIIFTEISKVISAIVIVAVVLQGCKVVSPVAVPTFNTHESGITYMITKKGNGPLPALNDIVKVHYELMLEDSTLIDSSFERGEPVSFKLGAGQVIDGWDIAMSLFEKGDEATVIIPPSLAYGDRPMGNIPANSTLIFKVQIVDIIPAPKPYVVPSNADIKQTPSGLKYFVVDKGRGKELRSGMRVKVHYTGFFEDMTIFDSSFEREQPIELTLGRGMVIRGWEEGLSNLRVGDKARLWIPYQLAYGEMGRGPIPPATNLIFDVQVVDAIEIPGAKPFDVAGKDTLETESGLRYIIVSGGRGEYAEPGSIATVHYSGYLTDGTMFDSSVERGQPFQFVLGQGQVIRGWDEGIQLMNRNAKYRFIIPSALGYGDRGAGPIPPGATLVFDVELIDFE